MIYVCSLEVDNKHLLEGKDVLTDLSELYRVIGNKETREIEIKDDFLEKYFTPSGIEAFVTQSYKINPFLNIIFNESYKTYYDSSVEDILNLNNIDDIVNYFLGRGNEAVKLLKYICKEYKSSHMENLVANNKISNLYLQLSEAQRKVDTVEQKSNLEKIMYNETRAKLDTLVSRINYNYNKELDESKLLGIDVVTNKFRKILYIKELTRVHYVDTLIYYLQEVLKTLYNVPARLLVIESPFAYGRAKLYPNCVSHTNLTYADVYSSDIFMEGFHSNIVEDILKNSSNIEYLIVLDRSGYDKFFLRGNGIEHLITVSDLKDISDGSIETNRVISYTSNTLHIPYIENFDKLNMEEKISKYSSMEIMQVIFHLLER